MIRQMRMPLHMLMLAMLAALLAFAAPGALLAQNRVALVIGNGVYPNLPQKSLPNPPNDARAMAAQLKASGFDTIELINGSVHQMDDAIEQLILKVRPESEVVVFYAGHGIEVKGANWLLPSDITEASVSSETRLPREAVNLTQTLLRVQERGARFTVFILDACREDPFPNRLTRSVGARGGLAAVTPPEGVFLMYSAAPGQFANDRLSTTDKHPNSPYTRHLLDLMKRDGLDLGELAKQLQERVAGDTRNLRNRQNPGFYDGASGRFFFRPAVARPAAPVAQAPAPAPAVASVQQPQTRSVTGEDDWARLPFSSRAERDRTRDVYLKATGTKALAMTPGGHIFWTTKRDATASEREVEKLTLQQCEFNYRQHCFIAVKGGNIVPPGPSGYIPTSALHAVLSDAALVSKTEAPFAMPSERKEFRAYQNLKGHRAAAITLWGGLSWARSSKSSEDAQKQALAACDSKREKMGKNSYGGSAPPCLLYAIDDRVVLKDRLIEPVVAPKPEPPKPAVPVAAAAVPTPAAPASAPARPAPPVTRPFKAIEIKFGKIEEARELETATRPWSLAVEDHTRPSTWNFTYQGSIDSERDAVALQRCEFTSRKPCAIVARNGFWLTPTNGGYARSSMLIERGQFVTTNIPFLTPDRRQGYQHYATIGSYKAMAIHPAGHLHASSSTLSQSQAQADALKACNDAAKKQWDRDCVLYAVGSEIVLHRRATVPIAIASVPAPQAAPVSPAARPFKASEAKFVVTTNARKLLQEFEYIRNDWALAVESATQAKAWFGAAERGLPMAAIEVLALQRCQIAARTPCFLYARNGQVIDHQGTPARRPVLVERGTYDANFLPLLQPDQKKSYEFYSRVQGHKAMAFHVSGTFTARMGASATQAQKEALEACNTESKKQWGFDCLLYAVGNEVVLHQRATRPIN